MDFQVRQRDRLVFRVADVEAEPIKADPFDPKDVLPNEPVESPFERTKKVSATLLGSSVGSLTSFKCGLGFVNAATKAYNNHHRLVIRPDDVWMAVAIQFARYVAARPEKLRDRFVGFSGKKKLKVELADPDWPRFCDLMGEEIAKSVKDPTVRDWIVPNFSTATQTDRVVGSVVLMSGLQNYFEYVFCICCGVPEICMLGTPEDWDEVLRRSKRLVEFETEEGCMARWTEMLRPVLEEMSRTKRTGKPDADWWNRMCHYKGGGSGPSYLSGWLTAFCVFSETGKWQGDKISDDYSRVKPSEVVPWCLIDTNKIPRGYVNCPVTVDDNGLIRECKLYAGHMAMDVSPADTVFPRLDWILFEES